MNRNWQSTKKADFSALIVLMTNTAADVLKKCHEVLHSQGGMAGVEEVV
jgi:hypothetical protein